MTRSFLVLRAVAGSRAADPSGFLPGRRQKPGTRGCVLPGVATLEVWIRRWRTVGRQAIVSQFDLPNACGLGLFVNPDGSLSFYLGDGGAFVARNMHTTTPEQLMMQINPQGLKISADNTPSSVLSNKWHHVVARFDGSSKQVWVDARRVAAWPHEGTVRPGGAPLRIGAAGTDGLAAQAALDADLAMPSDLCRGVSVRCDRGPIRRQASYGRPGLR